MSLTEEQRTEIQEFVESYLANMLEPNIATRWRTYQGKHGAVGYFGRHFGPSGSQAFGVSDSDDSVAQPTPALATERMVRVIARAVEVLGTSEKALRWLNTPIRSLGDQTPASLLGSPEGIASIEDALGRIEHGVW